MGCSLCSQGRIEAAGLLVIGVPVHKGGSKP